MRRRQVAIRHSVHVRFAGRGCAFPCDRDGLVNLNELSDGARNNYLYARAMVGREVAAPAVELVELH